DPHPFSTTTSCCLKYDWISDLLGNFQPFFFRLQQTISSGYCWNVRFFHGFFGRSIVSYLVDHFRTSPHESYIVFLTNPRKFRVFGKESITWMYGVSIGDFCCSDNVWNIQIRQFADSRAYAYCFVSKSNMKAFPVNGRINSYCAYSHFTASPDDP